jgi:hypothetical protein
MHGEFVGAWNSTWREIWSKLGNDPHAPEDLFSELYRELALALDSKLEVEELADRSNDPVPARIFFMKTRSQHLSGERKLVEFLENAHSVLEESAGGSDSLPNSYFNLLSAFVAKYSLRYDLRRPCNLSPTLPGLFASLTRDLQTVASQDPHLDSLMKDFERAIRDLSTDASDTRIKTCIQKQINLLEAIGQSCPGVTENTLGKICEQVGTWPHSHIKEAMKKLYWFACDYPGIRHAGTPKHALRAIEMRDVIAMSILLTGFTPYLTDRLDAERMYRGV